MYVLMNRIPKDAIRFKGHLGNAENCLKFNFEIEDVHSYDDLLNFC